MKKQEAEELFESMRDHQNIWPRGHEIHLVAREYDGGFAHRIDHSRIQMRRSWFDYGVGVFDATRDQRVEVWTPAQVDQLMNVYADKMREAMKRDAG